MTQDPKIILNKPYKRKILMNTKIKIIIDPKKHDRLELLKTIENTGIPCDINKNNIISVEKDKDMKIIAALMMNEYNFSVYYA